MPAFQNDSPKGLRIEEIFILLVTTQNLMGLQAVTEALSLNQDSKCKEPHPREHVNLQIMEIWLMVSVFFSNATKFHLLD